MVMRDIQISEETYGNLLILKNQWSLNYRKITNKEVLEKIDGLKQEVFGYSSEGTPNEIEAACKGKTRDELEEESEKFQRALRALLNSGQDFEPEYTLDMHIKKMIELIEESDEIGVPLF